MPVNLISTFRLVYGMLPTRRKRQYGLLVVLMLMVGLLETLTLGVVALFATCLTHLGAPLDSGILKKVATNFPSWGLNGTNVLYLLGAALCLAVIAKNVLSSVVTFGSCRFGAMADGFYGERLLRGFLGMPFQWHQTRNSADLIIAINWRYYLGTYFLGASLQLLCDVLVLIFLLATLLAVEPVVSSFIIIGFGLSAFFLFYRIKSLLEARALVRKQLEEQTNRDVTMTIHGMKDVKTFLREDFFMRKYQQGVSDLARQYGILQFYQKLPSTVLETMGVVSIVAITCGMLYMMRASVERVTGMLAMLVACAWRALPALNRILGGATQLKSSAPYIHNFLEYLGNETLLEGGETLDEVGEDIFGFKTSVEWQGVNFRYITAKTDALYDINLTLGKGEALGIVGPSGAGKSTLVDVLIGLNRPSAGRIVVDGQPLSQADGRRWRRMIGYVPQTPYIYDGSLAENIAFGVDKERIDRERVRECCRMAAIDFLPDLETGLDAGIGERGAKLSGGQRQRIAIARALYHRPRILIFDEATSALDTLNEKAIQDTIYALKGRITIILIAHRLSTVSECDRIVCLKAGRIVMTGPPETILPWYSQNTVTAGVDAGGG